MTEPLNTPDMPSAYTAAADQLLLDYPAMTIGEAYWHAAMQLAGVRRPPAATAVRRTGRVVYWREGGKQRQHTLRTPGEARSYAEWLLRGELDARRTER